MLIDKISFYNDFGVLPQSTPAQYKAEFEWLKEVDSLALANAQIQLKRAYSNFCKNPAIGFPKFKSRKNGKNSYTTNNQGNNIRIVNGAINLPKIGFVKLKQHRFIPGTHTIKTVTISLSASGRYLASIMTEYDWEPPVVELSKDRALGLDYSSPHFYVDSQGVKADMPHFEKAWSAKLDKEKKKLSNMKVGSQNYKKQDQKISKIYAHVANCRRDWLHKKSAELADSWDYVCVEGINMCHISKSPGLGKQTYENGFGMFRKFLEYKLADRGKGFIVIDRWFPSSKTCSVCGSINDALTLRDRQWTCECGAHHDRDLNAAINIKTVGLSMV